MPKEYVLKKDPMDTNRLKKVAKEIADNCRQDRKKAIETFDYFKNKVDKADEGEDVTEDKRLMVDCLKLAQTSKTNLIKLFDLLIKLEPISPEAGKPVSFDDMDEELSDD